MFNLVSCHADVRGGGVDVQLPNILFESQWLYSVSFSGRVPCAHRTGRGIGSRASLDVVEKNPYPRRKSNPVRSARRKSQMLSSPGSLHRETTVTGTTLLNNQQLTFSCSSIIFLHWKGRTEDY